MKLNLARLIIVIITGFLLAHAKMLLAAGNPKHSTGPTTESVLAADQQLAKALQNNDTVGIYRMLDKDWAVIPSTGAVYEGPEVFPSGIRSGYRTLRVMELSEPRVRLYGNVALVTTKVRLSGQLGGKSYDDLKMRQTDIWQWKDGSWKCVLTQEAVVKE